jgi:hypothetical protein
MPACSEEATVSRASRWLWLRHTLFDLAGDAAATRIVLLDITAQLKTIKREVRAMAAREDAAYEKLNATILTVKDGWASLVAERDALKEALENADAEAATRVQAALDADSDVDAGKVEAADAALAELASQPAPEPEPTPEP